VRIALVSRELHPLAGGGIGVAVAGFAAALAELGEVLVLVPSTVEDDYRQRAADGTLPWPEDVQVEFVPEPREGEFGSYYTFLHLYSARVLERLRELYPDTGPDVIEFPDFLGEGLVTVQARRGRERFLRDTQINVRLHTTAEMCSVLDGFVDTDFEARQLLSAEREVLREADRILWPGGDVLNAYRRFYGSGELADAARVRGLIAPPPAETPPAPPLRAGEELRLLYLGRLERRKGVQDLVRAASGIRHERRWSLTLVGGDTDTAPLGMSMRDQLELSTLGEERVRFVDELPRDELARLVAGSHVLVCPSRWECWPSVVLEGLAAGRPVLGTPTGGLVEMLGSGDAGWLTAGVGDEPLTRAIERLLDRPDEVDELIASGAPCRAYERLTDQDAFRAEYLRAAGREDATAERRRPSPADSRGSEPLVSVVIPYFRLDGFIEETVESVFAQEHRRLEVIVVNDGSLRAEDAVLAELATRFPIRVLTQRNAGLGRARNAGIAQSRGAYVFPLDADNMIRPGFIRRCLDVLEAEPDVAFATTWSQYIDEEGRELEGLGAGYQPVGNRTAAVLDDNVAGDAAAVIRRRVFDLGHWYSPDLTSYEDWHFYRELHLAGLYGRAIPERLLLYRVRADSMIRDVGLEQHGRLYGEMTAHLREKEMEWASRSG
jgi:glycosyltransferase involved in cell wall biosynthesis